MCSLTQVRILIKCSWLELITVAAEEFYLYAARRKLPFYHKYIQ